MDDIHVISFSYQNLPLSVIGKISFPPERMVSILSASQNHLQAEEVFCVSTCNRTEWICSGSMVRSDNVSSLIADLFSPDDVTMEKLKQGAVFLSGKDAALHVFRLCASLESMVVGEREILAQVRRAYDVAFTHRFASDRLRILMRFATECAKDIFTRTHIAEKPVSVASLAFRELQQRNLTKNKTFLVIGAGETNWKVLEYLRKQPDNTFYIFNRTMEKGIALAKRVNGHAFPFQEIFSFRKPFDVILVCTSSPEPILTDTLSRSIFPCFKGMPCVADLSVPSGIHPLVRKKFSPEVIEIETLKNQMEKNLAERKKELLACQSIIEHYMDIHARAQRERSVELLFGEIPEKVRQTKEKALTQVFAKELSAMDAPTRDVLIKVVNYLEKKYNAFAMQSAKEILLGKKGLTFRK